jgi:hypothetical protein|tara:strand:+ start:925 stop:1560 length:636 start_codon:yes stop_codon:yes gene_type:complete
MSAFGFMETSFFISLGISFVLILLLVYHFKQRLSVAEGKLDTMFEIINNLAQELSNVKSVIVHNNRPSTPFPHNMVIRPNVPLESAIMGGSKINEDEDDSESEYDSDDEDSDDEDNDDEKIIVSDVDEDDISVDLVSEEYEIANAETENTELVTEEKPVDVTQDILEDVPNFAKMNLGALRAYITEKGWIEDASKMKKAQIIELIENRSNA